VNHHLGLPTSRLAGILYCCTVRIAPLWALFDKTHDRSETWTRGGHVWNSGDMSHGRKIDSTWSSPVSPYTKNHTNMLEVMKISESQFLKSYRVTQIWQSATSTMKLELDDLDFIKPYQATTTVKHKKSIRTNKSKCRVSLTVCTDCNDCQCRPCKRRKFASRRHEPAIPLTSSEHASMPMPKRMSLHQTCLEDVLFSELVGLQLSSSNIDTTATSTTTRLVCSTDPSRGNVFQFTFHCFDGDTTP
jgi:hypothetical protein